MKIEAVELRRVAIPLRYPNETSFGLQREREVVLVRVETSVGFGWGECGASKKPSFSSEFNDSVELALRSWLVPSILAAKEVTAARVAPILAPFRGHRMAKAALEMAILDAELRAANISFANFLGAEHDSVPVGVSIGLQRDLRALLNTVGRFVDQGYTRVKLKIVPDWDIEPVRAVREHFGEGLLLQVDANATYRLADVSTLAQLDDFNLLLIEQPLGHEDMTQHAQLAHRLSTPICLDESIISAKSAADAIRMKACDIVNIKPSRVGGYLEARRIHDVCRAFGIPVWCGGMLETGLGRAANVALAALPGFDLPGDTSASDRYFEQDITEPLLLKDGHLVVPTAPGLGVEMLPEPLERFTTHWQQIGKA